MAMGHSELQTLGTNACKLSSDSDEGDERDGWSSSVCEGPNYSSCDIVNSPVHRLQTMRDRTDGGENEIEKLILAAEALTLERTKLQLQGLVSGVPSVTHLSPLVVKRTGRGRGERSLSAATTVSAREASSVHQRIKKQGMCEKLFVPDNNIVGAIAVYSSTDDDGVKIVKLTSNQPAEVADCDGSGRNSDSMDKTSECPINSFSDSVASERSFSPIESKNNFVLKENTGSGETVNNIPRLSLEHTDESGYSSQPHEEGQGIERPVVSKDEKDVCNSSIRGSSVVGSQEVNTGSREEAKGDDHTHGTLMLGLERGEVSDAIKEGCSKLLTLALTSTSNLRCTTRLVRQVMGVGRESPWASGGGVLEEVEEYETLHTNLETQLTSVASNLQGAVSGVKELEAMVKEQGDEDERVKEAASHLLHQVEAVLLSSGLHQHLTVALMSPRRCSGSRAVEDVRSGLTLVAGEVERRGQRIITLESQVQQYSQELHGLREAFLKSETRVRSLEVETRESRGQAKRDVVGLQQCLAQVEESLRDAQLERLKMSDSTKKRLAENSAIITDLKKKLCEVQHNTEARMTELEHQLQDSEKGRQSAEVSLGEVREQLNLRTKQMHLVNDENSCLIENLHETLKQQNCETEQQRQQLEAIVAEKASLTYTIHDLKVEVSRCEERGEELQGEVSEAQEDIRKLQQEHTQDIKTLQDKIDSLSLTRCELESQIRSLDLTVLQLRTEHQLERQRVRALTSENTELQNKAKDLQTRLWSEVRRRRNYSGDSVRSGEERLLRDTSVTGTGIFRGGVVLPSSEFSSCLSLVPQAASPLHNNAKDKKVIKCEEDKGNFEREEQLHTLLREKDVELHSLHTSLSQQLSTKDQELENLTEKLESLEGELAWVVSGLEASAALGDMTAEVGRQLQARTHHLHDLDRDSHALRQHYSQLSSENHSLNEVAVVAKQEVREGRVETEDAREEARRAREVARRERLTTAHTQEKCQQLQAKLDSALATLEQERQEQRLSQVVQGVKHREFSTLLESATAALHLTSDSCTLPL